ncbi:flagellar basal-body rod protein FlgC [Paenibacillus vortex V453]|jgi:flagellar basal-body rod protein FlgC|uniref:Flagellar basal-body rod protein FlgC n=2 Tax=Paenibacillus TaxID=44249 RepID=A0A163EDD2_9BACL|nr:MULTISPECIES: flagellar basal body rod protein FlgC [Paenibacillus]ANA83176.1 flagellar basal body rod protein FlgC [Paenibacillus glucanolyticus]AVV57733.1 flagellar basal body rod protein FlgC [Paenibacillus glucanolyticus]AWP26895.1 flagellar basal body rod protein FlgC [Paenibacillus sp. Cedars]EFU40128.1 flagellar basal-body rod protein FlgC [Paenibacillus vortex V453]ETT34508.1 flagellar basal-body rod protein FlgC [Paenibacillus sp. FSL R5-808]
MNISNSFGINASALTAQRLRMDVISSNIANAETTRARIENGQAVPYRRKTVVFQPQQESFEGLLRAQMSGQDAGQGVKVAAVQEDQAPLKRVYNPTHPDANTEGYVFMPNVDITKEMVDMLAATRSYEANVTAINASKAMIMKALEIGR